MNGLHIDFVIKFGGSAVTDKNSFETYRPEILSHLAQCIKKCHESGMTCVVVHGAGSFGHHQARQYAINQGLCSSSTKAEQKEKLWGFCLVRQSVLKLNQAVVSSLIDAGVPAIGFSPATSWEVNHRQPVNWSHKVLQQYLFSGLLPVFHGDCCMDTELICSILSGDTVIKDICSHFTVKKVVFVTDVDGIFDKPPHLQDAKLLKTIKVDSCGELQDSIVTVNSINDVTGGMKLKLQSAIDIVIQTKGLCPVYIAGYNSPCLLDLLLNKSNSEKWNVTEVVLSDNDS